MTDVDGGQWTDGKPKCGEAQHPGCADMFETVPAILSRISRFSKLFWVCSYANYVS